MSKAVVIGAGIGGIASAIRLAIKGYKVEVFEANSFPGGKLSQLLCEGYRFDAGPSLFTMPQFVDELFTLAKKEPSRYFKYQKLDNICRYFYEDGTRIDAWADNERFANEIDSKTEDSRAAVNMFFKKSAEIYDITNHIFLEKSLHKLSSYLNWKTLNSILRLNRIDPLQTMDRKIRSFFTDDRTIRLFNRYATYNGSDPYQAPATLNIIPHIEREFGAYFPEGGMYSITTKLVELAEEIGVKFHYNSAVQEICHEGGKVKSVIVDNTPIPADMAVSNIDIWLTYKFLLKDQYTPKRILKQERSSSALIFYWGIKKEFPELDLHNIFFSDSYKEEFKAIWKRKTIFNDPTIYINITSKHKPDDAPRGCENWFVMINVPSNSGQDWVRLIGEVRQAILSKISRNLGEDVSSLIACERVLDPISIERNTGSHDGALYGTSSNSWHSAFLRHSNFSSKIKGLYFTGGSVHPGGGIPLALLSAKIVGELVP